MFAERTMETGASSGTSMLTLGTSVSGWKTWRSQLATATVVFYFAEISDGSIWEAGYGTLTYGSPDTITGRVLILSSTGSLVDFASATVYVMSVPNAVAMKHMLNPIAATRPAWLQAGGTWRDYTLGLATTWVEKLATSAVAGGDAEMGRAYISPLIYVPSPRKLWEDVGANNLTLDADDIGKVLCFDCTAGQRTATLLASATAKHGYSVDVLAYGSSTNGVTLAPNGSDAINQLRIPPGGRWRLEWDGARSAWRVYPVVAVVPGQIFGLTLSTAGSSATFSIAAGSASDKTNSDSLILAAALSKTTSAWAVGSGNGGLDTGAIANSTWYHVHLIKRVDTGVVDALISTSATAPTMPTGYTLSRRIGAIQTNGSAQWVKFQQDGDRFYRLQIGDYTISGTFAATLRTLSIPLGIVVQPMLSLTTQAVNNTSTTVQVAPAADATLLAFIGGQYEGAAAEGSTSYTPSVGPPSNTSSQLYFAVPNYSSTGTIATVGWIDRRGQDA